MKKKLGIALGSGASRGWAHIGVLNAIDDAGITIDYLSGSSIGALVGAVYANGELDELERFAREITWKTVALYFDITFPGSGLISGKKIFKMLSGYFGKKKIGELSIPYCAVAADVVTGEEIRIDSGNLSDAVRSSISIPGIFAPYKYQQRFLVDGGIVNPVPVNVLKDMGADIVIAVDLNSCTIESIKRNFNKIRKENSLTEKTEAKQKIQRERRMFELLEDKYKEVSEVIKDRIESFIAKDHSPNILETLDNTTHIMQRSITKNAFKTSHPNITIEPQLGDFRMLDFDRAEEAVKEGYDLMRNKLDKLKQLL